jgi:hypothetical protein
MRSTRLRLCAGIFFALGLAACGDSGGTGQVNLQISTKPKADTAALSASAAPITLGGDEIVIEAVDIVLRKIRFGGVASGACDGDAGTEAGGEPEDCGEFRSGPELFELPLEEGVVPTFTATVPVGSYRQVQFQIHRPTDENGDAELIAAHPDFDGTSIRVTGTYQKAGEPAPVPFAYTTDLTSVLTVELETPIDVADGEGLAMTLAFQTARWFVNASGDGLVDPAAALDGQPQEALVEQNIRNSIRAFQDEDGDGAAD